MENTHHDASLDIVQTSGVIRGNGRFGTDLLFVFFA